MGLQRKRISVCSNLCIAMGSALISFIFCFLASMCAGTGHWPNYVGGGLLIILGLFPFLAKREKAEAGHNITHENDVEVHTEERMKVNEEEAWESKVMGARESFILAMALSLNCTASSFAAGMTGIDPTITAVMIGLFSFLAIVVGSWLGEITGTRLTGWPLEQLSGVMMILIGTVELFV